MFHALSRKRRGYDEQTWESRSSVVVWNRDRSQWIAHDKAVSQTGSISCLTPFCARGRGGTKTKKTHLSPPLLVTTQNDGHVK